LGQVSDIQGPLSSISVGGDDHVCGLRPDGTPVCWGDDRYGQSTPPADTFRALATGYGISCGIRLDHSVTCWGSGIGITSAPLDAPLDGEFATISVGAFICGVRLDGSIACAEDPDLPDMSTAKGNTYRSVATGVSPMICAVQSAGALDCWGQFRDYAWDVPAGAFKSVVIGNGSACALRDDGKVDCGGGQLQEGPFTQLAGGPGDYYAAMRADGTITYWGRNRRGAATEHGSPFTAVVDNCALRADKSVACWGGWTTDPVGTGLFSWLYGGNGICGIRPNGGSECWPDLELNPPLFARDGALGFAFGDDFFCEIKADGTVPCSFGFYLPGTVGNFKEISAARDAVCGIQTDGTLSCRLDPKHLTTPPTLPPPKGTFTALSMSDDFACAIKTDGTINCWGDTSIEQAVPKGQFTAVDTAGFTPGNRSVYVRYACGLRTNGDVACWGESYSAISRPGPFVSLSVNGERICAVTAAGTIECWGSAQNEGVPQVPASPDGIYLNVIR
jgi:alpha-tubulin suppressor-like RCC1 family protein